MTPLNINIVYSEGAYPLTRATSGASGWDICAVDYYTLSTGVVQAVRTGIRLEVPQGYEVQVRSRSGLAMEGIIVVNGVGTIDSDYRGEIKVLMSSLSGMKFIKKGDRIAQLVISNVQDAEFVAVDTLSDTQRGAGGFGSTGK